MKMIVQQIHINTIIKIIIKDFAGNTISEEIGCLNQSENGDWWIS